MRYAISETPPLFTLREGSRDGYREIEEQGRSEGQVERDEHRLKLRKSRE
jgi:hypothetical protein